MTPYSDVASFVADLDPSRAAIVQALRRVITLEHPDLVEHIKWNSPSYAYDGVDLITINVKNKQKIVQVILHMGPVRRELRTQSPVLVDDEGLVVWHSHIRGQIDVPTLDLLDTRTDALRRVIGRWRLLTALSDDELNAISASQPGG